MEWLLNIPGTVKVLSSLFLILLLNQLLKKLMIAVLLGTLLLAFWSGHPPVAILRIAWQQVANLNNLFFMLIIALVIWLSHQLSAGGVMKELVSLIRSRLSKRLSMAVLPAVIGLLPMPGGALFSAPLVADCDSEEAVDPLLKTKVNYWFRHIWEYWWPLYPGVLLAVELTGLEIWQFMLLQLPLSLVACFSGYFFLLRKIPAHEKPAVREKILKRFLRLVLPVIIIIVSYFLFQFILPAVAALNKYLPICTGIVLAIIVQQVQRPLSGLEWKKIILSRKTALLVLLVTAVRIYGAFIETRLPDGSFLSTQMQSELAAIGFPVIITIALLPFICGMVSGIAVGFVGASFPIVLGLIGRQPEFGQLLSTTVLAFGCGYIGMILSPVHICLIVTNEYFKTRLGSSILRLVKPALGLLAGVLAVSFLTGFLPFNAVH